MTDKPATVAAYRRVREADPYTQFDQQQYHAPPDKWDIALEHVLNVFAVIGVLCTLMAFCLLAGYFAA